MHLKEKAYSFGVPLLYILTVTLSSVGRCGPTAYLLQPTSPSDFYDRSSFLTKRSVSRSVSGDTRWFRFGEQPSRRRSLPRSNTAGAAGPEPRLEPMTVSSNRGARFKRRPAEGGRFLNYPNCSKGFIKHVVPGKFYVPGQFEPNLKHLVHQVDSVQIQGGQAGVRGQQPRGVDESWLRLEPTVECGEDAMILTVRRKRVMQLLLDRANESSLLLFQLPPQCGYSVRTTEREFSLKAQYDACHVAREDDSHVLPLLWRGTPVKVSCPVPQLSLPGEGPPALCCSQHGMTIKLQGSSVQEPRINVRGDWIPLSLLAKQCDYTVDKQDTEITVAVPFVSCGVTVKDEKQILFLQTGRTIYMLACSIKPLEDLPVTHQSLADSPDLTKHKQESFGPLRWIPPFYLAPPNYPHPTYPQLKGHDSFDVSTEAVFVSQPKHKDRYYHQIPPKRPPSSKHQKKDSGRAYQNKKKHRKDPVLDPSENSVSATRFTVQVETPPFQPPGHDFSSYYHYYHLPKIPLPGAPQDSGLGPGVSGGSQLPTNSQDQQFPSLIPNVQQSESHSKGPSDKSSPPMTTSSPHTFPVDSKVSALYAAYPPQYFPYYYYYYYFPHVSKGEAKRLGFFHPDLAGKTNLSFVHLPHSPGLSGHENKNLDTDKMDKTDSSKPRDHGSKRQSASVTPAVQSSTLKPAPLSVPPPEQTPGFTYNADPYKYYYHPYYNYYQMYYGPDALSGKYNLRTVTTPKAAASQTSPTSESMHDVQKSLNPYYYYYYLYYLPQMLKYSQKLRSQGSEDANKSHTRSASQLSSNLDYGEMQQSAPASGHSSVSLVPPSPLQTLYSDYNTQQPPEKHEGQRAKEKQDKESRDTAGQYFVFAMPDSVVDPSVAPPGPPFEDRRSCMQKLTSQPDIYVVPMDGCGVTKHMSGETMVHQLEVQGVQSHKDGGSSPVRLMVGCSSSPDAPGEARFHMLDQPSPPSTQTPSPVTVLLRIATDESFISYYPEAHLPLSLLQDKPVYVELKLLQPSETNKVLLVHSCLAYTVTPELRWLLFYDSCSSLGISQLLPSSDSNHIRRIRITRFPSLPMESSTYKNRGPSTLKDPEIYFLCLTELCSAAHGDCGSCIKGRSSDMRAK